MISVMSLKVTSHGSTGSASALDHDPVASAACRQHVLGDASQGNLKPRDLDVALSIRIQLDSPYPDGEIYTRDDGTWYFAYHQENPDPAQRDDQYTNLAVMRCIEERVPVGVMRERVARQRELRHVRRSRPRDARQVGRGVLLLRGHPSRWLLALWRHRRRTYCSPRPSARNRARRRKCQPTITTPG